MKIHSVTLYNAYERDLMNRLVVNGLEIASANYDEHGITGLDLLAIVAGNLACLANVTLEEAIDDDDI